MQKQLVKALTMKAISFGLKVPEAPIDRFIELVHLKELLTLLNINCVLDVGANRGQFAHELRGIGYQGHIISFEPIYREYSFMSQSFEHDANWTGYQIALGSENKMMKINIPKLTVMSSILSSVNDKLDSELQDVEVKRLDSLFHQITQKIPFPRVFLKMDTQGYDLEVFRGAEGCIGQIDGLQSELSIKPSYKNMPHYLEALEVYERSGFELYNLSVVDRLSNGGLIELNCFMKRTVLKK